MSGAGAEGGAVGDDARGAERPGAGGGRPVAAPAGAAGQGGGEIVADRVATEVFDGDLRMQGRGDRDDGEDEECLEGVHGGAFLGGGGGVTGALLRSRQTSTDARFASDCVCQ